MQLADLPGGLGADVDVAPRLQGAERRDAALDAAAADAHGIEVVAAERIGLPGSQGDQGLRQTATSSARRVLRVRLIRESGRCVERPPPLDRQAGHCQIYEARAAKFNLGSELGVTAADADAAVLAMFQVHGQDFRQGVDQAADVAGAVDPANAQFRSAPVAQDQRSVEVAVDQRQGLDRGRSSSTRRPSRQASVWRVSTASTNGCSRPG